jgi:hypothetical protein
MMVWNRLLIRSSKSKSVLRFSRFYNARILAIFSRQYCYFLLDYKCCNFLLIVKPHKEYLNMSERISDKNNLKMWEMWVFYDGVVGFALKVKLAEHLVDFTRNCKK